MKLPKTGLLLLAGAAMLLIAAILITQYFSGASANTLGAANKRAVETFKINNSIQQLVNTAFTLQNRLCANPAALTANDQKNINDSLLAYGYNGQVITDALTGISDMATVHQLTQNINRQLTASNNILAAAPAQRPALARTLQQMHIGDTIYKNCRAVQKTLSQSLQQTLYANTLIATRQYNYNKYISLLTIIIVLVLTTIIIVRLIIQLKLIDELKIAEAQAQRSKRAKDDFLANMSHELRTPLNALIGFGNLLHETPLQEQQREYLSIMQSGSKNLLLIVNDILDLSKIEAGKLKFTTSPFSIRLVLQNVATMLSSGIADKGLYFNTHIAPDVPATVIGDAGRLQQVLINLIKNAKKFTTTGGITVTITNVTTTADERVQLLFTIKDTGTGIPADKIATIFERFEQLEPHTQKASSGTGLGLTIAKDIIQKMGGDIWVESIPGKGSDFIFNCYFGVAPATGMPVALQAKSQGYDFTGYRILLVEDNAVNQRLVVAILEKYNATLHTATNGHEALQALKQHHFDIILMDLQMPEMDGYTALQHIRSGPQAAIPVIALTAYVSETEIQKCRDAGFNDYIPKPVAEQELVKKLQAFAPQTTLATATAPPEIPAGIDYLQNLLGNDTAALQIILEEMQGQWKNECAALKTALTQGNTEAAKKIIHSARSTFSPLGPQHKVFGHLDEMHILITTGNIASAGIYIEKITSDLQQITAYYGTGSNTQ